MKKYFTIVLLLSVFSFQLSVASAKPNKQVVVLSCDIHCQGCCDKIMKNIAFERGVKDLVCDLESKTVTVTYDANKTDLPTLLQAFERIHKPATVQSQPVSATNKKAPSEQGAGDATDADTGASMQ